MFAVKVTAVFVILGYNLRLKNLQMYCVVYSTFVTHLSILESVTVTENYSTDSEHGKRLETKS